MSFMRPYRGYNPSSTTLDHYDDDDDDDDVVVDYTEDPKGYLLPLSHSTPSSSKIQPSPRSCFRLRWGFRILLECAIITIFLLALQIITMQLWRSDPVTGERVMPIIPKEFQSSPKNIKYFEAIPELESFSKDSWEAWDRLMPKNRGFILVENPETYGLEPGIPVSESENAERYAISAFHQLHCLTLIHKSYSQLLSLTQPHTSSSHQRSVSDYSGGSHHDHHHHHHLPHCFTYLLQSIQCNADPTIEPARIDSSNPMDLGADMAENKSQGESTTSARSHTRSADTGKRKATVDGLGRRGSLGHRCRSWEALEEWVGRKGWSGE